MVLGSIFFADSSADMGNIIQYPLTIGAVCIVASIIGMYLPPRQLKKYHGRALQGVRRIRLAFRNRPLPPNAVGFWDLARSVAVA